MPPPPHFSAARDVDELGCLCVSAKGKKTVCGLRRGGGVKMENLMNQIFIINAKTKTKTKAKTKTIKSQDSAFCPTLRMTYPTSSFSAAANTPNRMALGLAG